MRHTDAFAISGRLRMAGLVVIAGLGGCTAEELAGPTPADADASTVSALIAPDVGVEQPGFTFLAPLGTLQFKAPTGVFDRTLLQELSVEICERSGSGCRMPLTKTFRSKTGLTMTGGLLGDAYQALWTITSRTADQGKVYRIRVLRGQTELGYADLEVVSWLEILRNLGSVSGSGKVPLGSIVPIRFHVAKETESPPTGTLVGPAGGTFQLAGGQVSLDIPAGAVASPTMITSVPATGLPTDGPAVAPGTAWDFGPDGTVFAHPVRMTIRYDPASLPPGTDESSLRIHKLVNGEYRQQNAGAVDVVNRTVSADVDGFSVYVVLQRVLGREEDLAAPVIRAVEVFAPSMGTWGADVTLDASANDVTARFRVLVEDDISGVNDMVLWIGRPSRPSRACALARVSGSDTQGVWECAFTFPRYDAGEWRLHSVTAHDVVRNSAGYWNAQEHGVFPLCLQPGGAPCLPSVPSVTLVSSPADDTPPTVSDPVEVSLNVTPRSFSTSVSVDVATGPRTVVMSVPFADDFGVEGRAPYIRLEPVAAGAAFVVASSCISQGSAVSGTFECSITFPRFAAAGQYYIGYLSLLDRVGNERAFAGSPTGPLCDVATGECLASGPIVEVISLGDTQAPQLQALGIAVSGASVTTTVEITDDLAGFVFADLRYRSATTSQIRECRAFPIGGPSVSNTATCTFTFSEFAARGSWFAEIFVADAAGNGRWYTRRAADGFLCYSDPGAQAVCRDFGETELVLP